MIIIDEDRIKYVKKIKLESNFYNVFRNTIRILLGQFKHRKVREALEKIISTEYYTYYEKLEKIDQKLRDLVETYISFHDYSDEIVYKIDNVTNCLLEENCEAKNYCIKKEDNCELFNSQN